MEVEIGSIKREGRFWSWLMGVVFILEQGYFTVYIPFVLWASVTISQNLKASIFN